MKKICTITCHDVYNAGASLQAYALMKYLQNQNYDVKIIDYKPDYLKHYRLCNINPKFDKNILTRVIYLSLRLPKRIIRLLDKRKLNYDRFTKKKLCVTKETYCSNEQLRDNLPEADIFIAGSDQIWNPVLDNGKDPAFYLDFVPDNKKKIAYAGSFSVSELPKELKNTISGYLKKFDALSVRETSAVNIISDLGINDVEAVLDPVFLLGIDEWRKICIPLKTEKYVLIYDFDWSENIKLLAKKVAEERGIKIYSVLNCDYADKCFDDIGPDGFVSLVSNAELVISNSFHATAFSIIFNKPFFVFRRSWGINTRIEDLVNLFGLSDRLIDSENVEYGNLPDWNLINQLVSEKIVRSKMYLKENLEN